MTRRLAPKECWQKPPRLPLNNAGPYLRGMPQPLEQPPPDSEGDAACPPTFEQALDQLEEIVHQLEEGEIGLAEALGDYEKGIGLLKQCYGLLERAERRIELLSGVDAAGNPITEPFADDVSTLDEKSQNRSRRRSKAGGKPQNDERASPPERSSPPLEIADSAQVRIDEPGSLF